LKKPETNFKEKVQKDLEKVPNTWFVKIQQVSIRGIPDFLICCNGNFVAIELKKDEHVIRNPLQEWTLECIAHAGGMGIIVDPGCWKDALDMLHDMAGERREKEDYQTSAH